ncbi:hypothetical protein EDD17DRAFT_1515604 [Pisolithus thermaeus]|nr:hypothetical protein EDD17DRAFT_1515604 [Pisolithus thermaeus]
MSFHEFEALEQPSRRDERSCVARIHFLGTATDYEGYESQSRRESSDQRSGSSAESQLVVEWLRSTPQPLDGMPRGNEEGAPRFSGHPDDLIWFLEDVRELCMQAGCYEDREWARWSIYYLGIKECPTVCYSKCDLYDLVDKQKKVKIDSYQALLNYRQLLWIEKDDLFLEGFDQEFQSKILQRLKWNDRRQYVDDPWPTYQVAREAERLLKEGYCFELREARLARDQWSAREAQYEAEMQQSRADSSKPSKVPGVGSRSQAVEVDRIESSFKCIEVTSCIAKGSLTAGLQGECLRGRLEEKGKGKVLGAKASVEPETTEAWGDSQVSQPEYFHSSLPPLTDIQPQIPPIELRDMEDKQRANKQPVEAEAHALEVPQPTLEPRGDLCEVPEQAGSVEVEEIELGVEAKGQSKGWTRSLGVETCTTSPSALSQPAKRSGTTALRVNDVHSLAPRTCSAAAVEIYTSLSQKSKNCLFKGYEVYGRKAIWSAASSFRGHEAGDRAEAKPRPHWHSGQDLSLTLRVFMFFLECTKVSEESDEHETPSRLVCLLWRVFSVFLEDALWSVINGEGEDMRRTGHPTPWLWVEEGYPASIYEYLGHQERAKRWQSEAPP